MQKQPSCEKMCCPIKPGGSSARLKVIQGVSHPVHNSTTLKVILKRFWRCNSLVSSSKKYNIAVG